MQLLVQLVSLVGAALILTAFIGLQRKWWRAQSPGYLWANFLGALHRRAESLHVSLVV